MAPRARITVLLLVLSLPALDAPSASAAPWRLADSLPLPATFSLGGSYRVRYETLDGQFRAGGRGGDQVLVERLLLAARYDAGGWYGGAELLDARAQLDDAGTPLGTDDINTLEPLQAYLGWHGQACFAQGDRCDLRAGRQTLDLGGRRLLARNQFRNTPNAFSGLVGRWHGRTGQHLTAFFTLPLERRPDSRPRLAGNEAELDREDTGRRFWGFDYCRELPSGYAGEIYLLALDEDAGTGAARELYTPGLRAWRGPAPGRVDFELETALQFGQTGVAGSRLDHFAHFHHVTLGYTRDDAWHTRVLLLLDYASGDAHAGDGDDGRFDTLYGARRFEYGPTGIFGAILRNNVASPGLRLEVVPNPRVAAFAGYRAIFLAAVRDAWTPAGLRDPTAANGRFVGHQLELNLRYDILPGNLRGEAGAAWLAKGRFARAAPAANSAADSVYAYAQLTLTF